ncbi:hypothetical protein [Clostridium saccharoperbutylacetonicum]
MVFLNVYNALGKVLGSKALKASTGFSPAITKGAIVVGATVAEAIKLNEAAKLGPITSGRLSDMTDGVGLSPGLTKMLEEPKEDTEKEDNTIKDTITNMKEIYDSVKNAGNDSKETGKVTKKAGKSKGETPEFIKETAKKLAEKSFKGNVMDSAVSGEIVLALHKLR